MVSRVMPRPRVGGIRVTGSIGERGERLSTRGRGGGSAVRGYRLRNRIRMVYCDIRPRSQETSGEEDSRLWRVEDGICQGKKDIPVM